MKILLKILLFGVLASCGGGNSVTPNPQVTTIGGTGQSQFTLANFSDADWLYNNYFGEYNLPAGFKASIIDDLKRAANSMVMYDAQGGDSQQMMVKMDMMAREAFTKEMSMSSIGSAFTSYDAANIKADKQASSEKMLANGIKPLTDVEIVKIKQEQEVFNKLHNPNYFAYVQQQKALVDTYSLPYALSNSTRKVYNIEMPF